MQASKLQIHGLGIVAANKPLNSHEIEVTPAEDLPMLDGELSDNVQEHSIKGKDPSGASYESAVNATVSIKATWLPLGSNRVTPPDVRRGETVVLYRFGDVDKYYWASLHYDMSLRKRETIIFAISNTADEDDTGSTPETTYFMEFSTHNKMLHIHTSNNDGEPFVYDIQLNTKEGYLQIQDDIGNFISMDSTNVRLELKNSDGSHLDMNRKIITMTAPDTINLKAGNNINMEAGKSINSKAGSSINDDTQSITTKAATTKNTVPTTTTTGQVIIQGGMAVSGGGGATVSGDMQISGGDVTADSISLKDHRHIEQGDGSPTSSAVA